MARGKYKRKRERRLQEETERIQKAAQACKLSQHMSKLVFDMGIKELCQKTDEELLAIKGLGPAALKQIRTFVNTVMAQETDAC